MALSQATLKSEILKVIDEDNIGFVGWPTTPVEVADNWGNAYNTYALSAEDISTDSLAVANLSGFKSALTLLMPFDPVPGTALLAATAFESAFIAYWTAATFAIAVIPPPQAPVPPNNGIWAPPETSSIVTAVTPAVLYPLLLAEFALNESDADIKADALATAFHTATTTAIFTTIIGFDTTVPPAGPYPIINISTIF